MLPAGVSPSDPVTLAVNVIFWPKNDGLPEVLRLVAVASIELLRLTTCGLPFALSRTIIVPVRTPGAVGVKVAVIAQLPPGAIVVDVQLSVSA
jgi:hypothetical protein